MNQILVTEKIYVTPELKRKKKIYKFLFILSIFCIVLLFTVYIYAEYDIYRDENVSQNILSFFNKEEDSQEEPPEDALIVAITQDALETLENNTLTQAATFTYTAPDGNQYEMVGSIKIPKISIEYPILADYTDNLMKVSPCRYNSTIPNEIGNLCIIGHNYRRRNVFFSDLKELTIGDIIEIEDLSKRKIEYEIYDVYTVPPEDTSDTTIFANGKKEVTLITCTDDTKQRIIIKATEKR